MMNLRHILPAFMVFPLAAAIWGTVVNFGYLESMNLAGVFIIALIFFSMGVIGLYMQMDQDFDDQSPPGEVIGAFLGYIFQFGTFIIIFFSITWIILITTKRFLPASIREIAFVLLWMGWVGLSVKFLMILSERGVIGPRFKDE